MMRVEKVVVMGATTTTAGTVALKVYTSLNTNFSFVYQNLGDFFFHTAYYWYIWVKNSFVKLSKIIKCHFLMSE